MNSRPEVWLRGPIAGIPALLQPVAHSLLQCSEELGAVLPPLTAPQISTRPAGAASVAFHVRHAAGSLDRLFTYARGQALDSDQRAALSAENELAAADPGDAAARPIDGTQLLAFFQAGVERALAQLRATDEQTLLDRRVVGRAQLPSTVLGLLFHAAEHTQRHAGQAVTTAKIVIG